MQKLAIAGTATNPMTSLEHNKLNLYLLRKALKYESHIRTVLQIQAMMKMLVGTTQPACTSWPIL